MKDLKVRLYVDHPLGKGQTLPLTRSQAHYLFRVMRFGPGDVIGVFNGRDGEWRAKAENATKHGGTLKTLVQFGPQVDPPDLWLLFAPIKKARTDFIVEKATEMGASRILPVRTEFTNAERVRQERLQTHAIEAAEQCGGTFVPEVAELGKLGDVLAKWPEGRQLMFCDEALAGDSSALPGGFAGAPWAILIGPEGGFSDVERDRLGQVRSAHPVSLGPRILRADTAAVAAMTIWQRACGDWA